MRVECVPTYTGVAMPKPNQQASYDELGCSFDVVALIKRMEAINNADAKLVRLLQERSERSSSKNDRRGQLGAGSAPQMLRAGTEVLRTGTLERWKGPRTLPTTGGG